MSTAAGQKAVRKFPPPCWTRDEALVLIEAYRERWYALHRAFLRTPDWDAVAEKVTTSCPDVTPPKTSAQCRHKMEKLRQRHRAEKQRASAFSGERFFSSWFYFEAMEAMENGYDNEPGDNHRIDSETHNPQSLNSGRGSRFKPLAVQNLVTLATSSTKHTMKSRPKLGPKVSNRYSYPNNGMNQEDDEEDGWLEETQIEETMYKGQKEGFLVEPPIRETKIHRNSSIGGGGIRNKPPITPQPESGRSGLRPRKFSKVIVDDDEDDNGGMWVKVPRPINPNPNLFKGRYQNENVKEKESSKRKKKKKKNGGISSVVTSIKLLGDGFLKMEKMKIDMAREMEKMRMETEMKRNQLILESQKQIVDAFVKGVIESRKQPTTMAHL